MSPKYGSLLAMMNAMVPPATRITSPVTMEYLAYFLKDSILPNPRPTKIGDNIVNGMMSPVTTKCIVPVNVRGDPGKS